ncbi:hypothetical protein D3C85_1433650 [compost metagenome]
MVYEITCFIPSVEPDISATVLRPAPCGPVNTKIISLSFNAYMEHTSFDWMGGKSYVRARGETIFALWKMNEPYL